MTDKGIHILLASEPPREPLSESEAERLVEFFCGKEGEDETDGSLSMVQEEDRTGVETD